jgi:hypothetical protein
MYNEQNGSMRLNSTYADLLDNYLSYFLPIDKCDVDFPSLNPSNKTNDQNEFSPTKRQQVLSATNHPRLLKLNQTTQFLQTSTNFEPKSLTLFFLLPPATINDELKVKPPEPVKGWKTLFHPLTEFLGKSEIQLINLVLLNSLFVYASQLFAMKLYCRF